MPFTPITPERKNELIAKGYSVEDMHAAHGEQFKGQFRFMIDETKMQVRADECGDIQYSEADAWSDADQYQRQLEALMPKVKTFYTVLLPKDRPEMSEAEREGCPWTTDLQDLAEWLQDGWEMPAEPEGIISPEQFLDWLFQDGVHAGNEGIVLASKRVAA